MTKYARSTWRNALGIWGDIIAAVLKHLYTRGQLHR